MTSSAQGEIIAKALTHSLCISKYHGLQLKAPHLKLGKPTGRVICQNHYVPEWAQEHLGFREQMEPII